MTGYRNLADDELGRLRAHITALSRRGIPHVAIEEAAGVCRQSLGSVVAGRRGASRRTFDAVMAVTPGDIARENCKGWVPALGSKRRLSALMAAGWPLPELGRRSGQLLQHVSKRRWVTRDTHDVVAELYRRLSTAPGPAVGRSMAKVTALGYAPPLAWAGIDIDDPAARPRGSATPDGGSAEALRLIRGGRALADAAAAVGVTVGAVTQAAQRSSDPAVRRLVAAATRAARLDRVAS